MTPIPVEITNQTDWWQPYVPPFVGLVGALIVASAAFYGVVRSNRTNLEAIAAADRRSDTDREEQRARDFRLWQRDTLLRVGDEVVEAAAEAHEKYFEILTNGYEPSEKPLAEVDKSVRSINAKIARLQLMGAHEAATSCAELHRAINTTPGLGAKIVQTYEHEGEVIIAGLHGASDEHEARRRELNHEINDLMLGIYSAREAFVETVERELARSNEPPNQIAAKAS
jgi:hypothetical protein